MGKEKTKHVKRTREKAVRLNQTRSGKWWQRIASPFSEDLLRVHKEYAAVQCIISHCCLPIVLHENVPK